MKSLKLIAVLLFLSTIVFAGNDNTPTLASSSIIIKGVVIDKVTKEALAGVKIYFGVPNGAVYTDLDGKFEIMNIGKGLHNISTNLISYEASTVKVECSTKISTVKIELDTK